MLGYAKRKEAERQGFAMLAPLWTDIDASSGEYFYHIYDLTKHVQSSTEQARVKVLQCVDLCYLFEIISDLSFYAFDIYVSGYQYC